MSIQLLKQLSEETGQPVTEVLDNALDAHRRNLRKPRLETDPPSNIACEEDRPVPLEIENQEPLSLLDPDADLLDAPST